MYKIAMALMLFSLPAFAEEKPADPTALQGCNPIGQSANGELIYGMDCKALKPENRAEVLPNMPPTNMERYGDSKVGCSAKS